MTHDKTFMMKIFWRFALAVMPCMVMSGCTQDGGHIGPWFGEGLMTEVDVDGCRDQSYDADTYWYFQSDIIVIGSGYGTWTSSDDDNTLTVRFDDSDDDNARGSSLYSPDPATHLPLGVSNLEILQLSSSDIVLRYIDPADPPVTYTYHLKKWW